MLFRLVPHSSENLQIYWRNLALISFVIYDTVKHPNVIAVQAQFLNFKHKSPHFKKKNLLFKVITTPFRIHIGFLQWEFNCSCTMSRSSTCTINDNIQNSFSVNLLWREIRITLLTFYDTIVCYYHILNVPFPIILWASRVKNWIIRNVTTMTFWVW